MNSSIYKEMFLRKKLPFIYKFVFVLFTLIIIVIFIIINMNYTSIINTKGIIKSIDDSYYIALTIKEEDIKYLINNNSIYINNNNLYYKIHEIDENLYNNNNSNYKIVYLKAKLDKEYKINNLNVDIKLNKENKKIIYYIIDYLKER